MAVSTAAVVSAGGLWKTPKLCYGISTPLFRVTDGYALMGYSSEVALVRVCSSSRWMRAFAYPASGVAVEAFVRPMRRSQFSTANATVAATSVTCSP